MDAREFMQAAAALRKYEHDGLRLFRPTEAQETSLRRMTMDQCFEILIDGGNRSGKTTLAAAFFASFVRDEPITCWSGEQIHCRPKHKRGKPVNTWIIGDHLRHLGMTIYRLLFDTEPSKPVFRIIPDELTGALRAWNPAQFENDWDRRELCQAAPPLIGPNLIVDSVFAPGHKTDHEFRYLKLSNGSSIYGFASSGEVKQGDGCDLIWNDENIVNKWYYNEWLSRLREDEGMIMWSTIPRDSCYVYNEVISRLDNDQKDIDSGDLPVEECFTAHVSLQFLDSPFIPERQKELALLQLNDRDAMVRIYGKTSTRLIAVYQDYNANYHVVDTNDGTEDGVIKALRENNWVPPGNWMRELVLDPGTQKPAILLCAVPPPDLWADGEPYFIPYREIFIRRASPSLLAETVMKTECDFVFERFIIDGRAGRQTPMGFVEKVAYQYTKAFRAVGLKSRQTESNFVHGDDDFTRRSKQVIRALRSRPCGRPQLRILNQLCPELVKQMNSNVRKTTPDGEPTEEPANNQVDDLRVCLEYWISRQPKYFAPPVDQFDFRDPGTILYEAMVAEWQEHKARQPKDDSILIGVP